ncbi:MAG: peptidoglycan DD-metalloendopeptidase family protein [Leptospiraceae bacterium]|nr:peptidoglycan DD-metalloendopeptidase family protein [Leptospiraceae bacterium]
MKKESQTSRNRAAAAVLALEQGGPIALPTRKKQPIRVVAPTLGKIARYQQKVLTWIRKKRNERLTLMFIPHNELRIRNYHISNLTLIILGSLLAIVLVVSTFLVIRHNSTIQEIDKLRISHKDAELQFAKVRQEIIELSKSYEEIRQNLAALQSLSQGNGENPVSGMDTFSAQLAELQQKAEQNKDPEKIPLEIFLMNRMLHDMELSRGSLLKVQEYIKKRERVLKNTPTIWPVEGYIVNPYGFVRLAHRLSVGYNPGVDIAVPHGAAVFATAPGIVVSINREANLTYTVRIRHNYGYETVYKGIGQVTVSQEEKVNKGEQIGHVGHADDNFESILHYEVHIGAEAVNPLPYLPLAGA